MQIELDFDLLIQNYFSKVKGNFQREISRKYEFEKLRTIKIGKGLIKNEGI